MPTDADVRRVMPLVEMTIRREFGTHQQIDDILGAAYEGMWLALTRTEGKKADPSAAWAPSTIAVRGARWAALEWLRGKENERRRETVRGVPCPATASLDRLQAILDRNEPFLSGPIDRIAARIVAPDFAESVVARAAQEQVGEEWRGRALWEHAACGGELRDADPSGGACPGPGAGRYPNLPDGAVFEAEIKRECYHVADREGEPLLATGAGGNFPGLVVEWEWLSPAWPPYRLELGALAYARQRFEALANPLALAAIGAAAGRLQGTLVSPETLVATLADLAGEFEIG